MKLFSWLAEAHSIEEPNLSSSERSPEVHSRLEELAQISVKDIMIPRALVQALDADVQLRRVRRLKSAKVTYFPVYKGDLDRILGWISKARVLELLNDEDARLEDNVKPVGSVREDASVADLADAFIKAASPFLTVKSSQGSTVGIVPLTEFVELMFGLELEPAVVSNSTDAPPARTYEI